MSFCNSSVDFILWCIANCFCLCFVKGVAFLSTTLTIHTATTAISFIYVPCAVFLSLAISSALFAAFAFLYWIYLNRQGQALATGDALMSSDDIELGGITPLMEGTSSGLDLILTQL